MTKPMLRRLLLNSACGLAVAAGWFAGSAMAQTQPRPKAAPAANSPDVTVGEILVTGTRAATAFNSPTPVATVDANVVSKLAISNFADALNELPAFRPDTTPASNFFQVKPNISGRTMDLRGLGQQRTLVLVDGQRFVGSNDLGTLDLNEIPSSLIKRSEVVTGGASAAYGADAIAGVVNIILDNTFTGLKMDANVGRSERGDNENYFLSVAGGRSFADMRGHVLFGMEYAENRGVGDCRTRSWCNKYTNYIPNPGWPGNGLPATLVENNAQFVLNTAGLIPTGPLKGTTFDLNGNPIPFTFGQFYGGGSFMVGGDASVPSGNLFYGQPLVAPDKHFAALARVDYSLSDSVQASLTLHYAQTMGGPVGTTYFYAFSRPIAIDNAYVTPALRQLMAGAGLTSVPVSKFIGAQGPQENLAHTFNRTFQASFQLTGDVWKDWRWDATAQYGEQLDHLTSLNIRNKARFSQAIDAVVAPNGQIVCRSTLTNPTDGCIPLNWIGDNSVSQAALAWVAQDAWQTRDYQLATVEANLRGTLFKGWAGPITGAFGVDYRRTRDSGDADPNSVAGVLNLTVASILPTSTRDVKEAYGEFNAPLLAGLPFVDALTVDGAVRFTSYSDFGSATTWKAGVVYHVNSDLMFRYTRSHDIREPNAQELNPLGTSITLPLADPVTHSTPFVTAVTSGNPKLALEKGETSTLGVVYNPSWLHNLQVSLDHYDIRMNNAIDTISAQGTLNLCSAGVSSLCSFIARNSAGVVTQVTSTYQNLATLSAAGYELVANYSVDLSDLNARVPGELSFTLNGNYVERLFEITPAGALIQMNNWTGDPGSVTSLLGVPRYKVNGYATYTLGPDAATLSWRYIPKALIDPTKIGPEQAGYSPSLANSISTNQVASRFYVDLSGSHKFTTKSGLQGEIYGSISNLFDTQEPPSLRIYGNPLYFDPVGRAYKIGLRLLMN